MTVRVDRIGEVTVVTLARPDVRNAVDSAHAHALYEAFLAFDADAGAKVAVFHGAHGHFCAGWDLQSGAKLLREPQADAAKLFAGLDFQADDRQPLGPMGPSRFGVYCRRFGVPLIDGGTVRLPRLIGMGHAMDLILTGRKVEAAEALQIGLCNRVVPSGTAREAAIVMAQQLAAFPQKTMLADRQSAYTQWDLPLPQALQQEWDRGKRCISEGLQGAARFAAGEGRHGEFNE